MDQRIVGSRSAPQEFGCRAWHTRAGCSLLLWVIAAGANAASVYRCADAHGHLAYQDTPCARQSRQRELDVQPQPLIGAPGEHAARVAAGTHHRSVAHPPRRTRRSERVKQVMS